MRGVGGKDMGLAANLMQELLNGNTGHASAWGSRHDGANQSHTCCRR
jgi:hypothetical protein